MSAPTLEEIVQLARRLADDIDGLLAAVPDEVPSRDLRGRVAVLEAQSVALRGMRPNAQGFLPERLTWSMGQSVSVVLPSAMRRLVAAGFVTDADVDRCRAQSVALADALRRYETA